MKKQPFTSLLRTLFSDRRIAVIFALGFSSGLPLLLIGSTLQAWCKDSGLNIKTIGWFTLVSSPYTFKFLWSPFLDHFVPPILGRRRGWLAITQMLLIVSIGSLGFFQPDRSPITLALLAFAVGIFSATQDIAVDAYQVEILETEIYAFGNQAYVLGYRLAMIISGGGSLLLADRVPWTVVYLGMSSLMLVGLLGTYFAIEPKVPHENKAKSFRTSVMDPIKDFFFSQDSNSQKTPQKAFLILAFFVLYKLGGDLATGLSTAFYKELNFSNTQIGAIIKGFGFFMNVGGGLVGAALIVFLGLRRSLWVFGILQGLANLSFAWLNHFVEVTKQTASWELAITISIENFGAGLGTAAYGCYMASIVNRRYTATQFALLTSLMAATRVYAGPAAGYLSSWMGWTDFFIFTAFASIPGLMVLYLLNPPQRLVTGGLDQATAMAESDG